MTVNGGDCDWGSGDLCRTGLAQSCTVNFPKHCDHALDGQRATVLPNWKFCVFPLSVAIWLYLQQYTKPEANAMELLPKQQ